MEKMTLTRDQIVIDPKFNVRLHTSGTPEDGKLGFAHVTTEQLAASIKKDGQITPVHVSKLESGKYALRTGFRRAEAIFEILKKDSIEALLWEGTEADARVLNLLENIARRGLSTFEIATGCAELEEKYEMSHAEIGKRVGGLSKGYVGNLCRAKHVLAPSILEAWKNQNGALTVLNLIKLMQYDDHDEQVAIFEEMTGKAEQPDGEGTGGGDGEGTGDGEKKEKPPASRRFDILAEALAVVRKMKKADPNWRKGAVEALEFAMAKREAVGEYDLAAMKAAKEKEKAEEREAKKMAREAEKAEKKAEKESAKLAAQAAKEKAAKAAAEEAEDAE